MPRKTPYPVPLKRLNRGSWQIIWRWDSKQYSAPTGFSLSDEIFAEQRRIEIAIALKSDFPAFPTHSANELGVLRYIRDRYGAVKEGSAPTPGSWLDEYRHEIEGKNTRRWVEDSLAMLEKLRNKVGRLDKVEERQAAAYMAEIAKNRKPGTHNRTLTVFKKFYSWLRNTRRFDSHPFKAIKRMNEGKDTPIVYCTPEERDELIAFAESQKKEWPEWVAIPIAFYTGMRKGEIAALDWKYVNFASGTIFIEKSKTKTSRTIVIHKKLEKLLSLVPEDKRSGFIVPSEASDRLDRLKNLANKLRKMKKADILAKDAIKRPQQSKAKAYKEKRKAYDKALAARTAKISEAVDRIGWNAFRHTFASLAVQNGIEIDTVSAWIGDTPTVCRRHYAQFIPRDRRDHRIDSI